MSDFTTIQITKKTKKKLIILQGKLQFKEGKQYTMNNVIEALLK